MKRPIFVALFAIFMMAVSVPAMALPKEVTTKKDILLPGKVVDRIVQDSGTNLVTCTIKAGKYSTNGYIFSEDVSRGGIFITYVPRNPTDKNECPAGIHFIPMVPIEVD